MKSKIEEKIKNAREATNEMFAAFEELNESLKEKELEKYLPQRGEYIFHKWADRNGSSASNIIILKSISDEIINAYVYFCSTSKNCVDLGLGLDGYVNRDDDVLLRPATPSEIALLDSKLAEQGKRFDKEKLELVDIEKPKEKHCDNCSNYPNCGQEHNCFSYEMWEPKPKHKEPIIGEMAIFTDGEGCFSVCRILLRVREDGFFMDNYGSCWRYAYLFESPEQYKAFLKS